MDKNTITGIILIFLIFLGFSLYNNNRTGKLFEAETEYADSLYNAGNYDEAREAYIRALGYRPKDETTKEKVIELNSKLGLGAAGQASAAAKTPADSSSLPGAAMAPAQADTAAAGAFAPAVAEENEFYTIENDLMVMTLSSRGGKVYSVKLKEYQRYDSLPVVLFNGDSTVFGYKFFTFDNKPVITDALTFSPLEYDGPLVAKEEPVSLTLRLDAGNGASIDYIYTVRPDDYMIGFETRFNSMGSVIPANTTSLALDWKMYLPQQEKGRQNEDMYTGLKYKVYQEGVVDVGGARQRQKKDVVTENLMRTDWIAYKDQFFSSVIIADGFFLNASVSSTNADPTSPYLRFFESEIGVPYTHSDSTSVKMKMYFGPNSFTLLKKYDLQLEELVFLGRNIIRWINQYVIIPIFNLLDNFIVNYGLIILILTLLIKLVLFPLTHRSFLSQAKMRVLKPMVDEIGKKFPKQEDAMKKQQATMEFYKKAGVSPMGGCLPMLLQMPILFAMFRFFPTSIELRQESFLWAKDLSTYDSILDLPFTIPMYGDHVSLFTLLMTVSTIISTKFTNPSGGQEQMPGMKTMMYMMPVMFMLILNNFSAGLTYYYFLANVITIIQTQVSRRFVDEAAILKKIEENKKKPVKKSKWQQRLEEAQKRSGYKVPKKK
ncbi:MAG: membrane protein insertase YidC [Bacteroidales bacterium]|jgi:YidC/Oxa1 family membrane protein insertase|nr:membrane protein insertase YidC [Bacteroidales bacterium]